MSRIYVSSTFTDLREHRAAVATAIRRLGHVDVAMEHYVAEPMRPLDRCTADAASSDLYVGLFARRYGYVPPGHDRSITELEYRAAERRGVDRICFLLDDEVPWPDEQVETGAGGDRLAALLAEIRETTLTGFFTTPDELAAIATAGIVRALDPGHTPFDAAREHRLFRQWRAPEAGPRERVRAQQALAAMGSPRYAAELKRLLLDAERAADVERIAYHLEELQRLAASRHELLPIFLDLLDASDSDRRFFAVFHLGELGLRGRSLQPEIVEALVALADDPDPGVRREVAHTLGKLVPDDRARPGVRSALGRLAGDEVEEVRAEAGRSLGQG